MAASVNPDRTEWDVIVIGAGAVGENAAQYAIQYSGLEAVMVEAELVGGECSYWACMPSKALLRPIEVLNNARDLAGTAQVVGERRIDAEAVLARRDKVINNLDDSSQVTWALNTGIDVVRGYGRLSGEREVTVTAPDGGTRVLRARQAVVLDTGSAAAVPPVPGLREARPWTSRDVTNLHEIPASVVIVGGGVVACEAATWLIGLGVAEVTVIEGESRLLAKNEPFAGELIEQQLTAAGVTVLTGTRVESAARAEVNDAPQGHRHGGKVTLTLTGGATVTADEVIVAAGRKPNSDDIGLESVGLRPGGYLAVDDQLTVTGVDGDWLYAVGDLCGRALLTHMGKYQARIAGEVIAARAAGTPLSTEPYNRFTDVADHDQVPQVTFTDPEVASVGVTEAGAREAGKDVETVEYDLAALAGTYVLRDDYVGRAKLVIDREHDVLLGATFVGTNVAELLHSATVAVVGKVALSVLWHCVPSYPTVSEVWLRLLEARASQRHS